MSAPAQPAPTRAAHRRRSSRPLERDEGLALRKLEHAITRQLAHQACLELCEEMSRHFDAVHASERMDGLQQACGGGL
jgi:hypothetical protein